MFSSKGESYACHQEQAYHTVPGRFNLGVIITGRAGSGRVSSASASPGRERRAGLDRTGHAGRIGRVASEPRGANVRASRRGYRNGSYNRAGAFHTQVFERYARYEPEVAEALTDMFVSGTSTQNVGKVAEKLLGVAPSASAVSRLNQALTEQYEAWRERRLLPHYRIIYAGRSSILRCAMGPKRMRR